MISLARIADRYFSGSRVKRLRYCWVHAAGRPVATGKLLRDCISKQTILFGRYFQLNASGSTNRIAEHFRQRKSPPGHKGEYSKKWFSFFAFVSSVQNQSAFLLADPWRDNNHGSMRFSQDLFRHAAEERVMQLPFAVAAKYDHIDIEQV